MTYKSSGGDPSDGTQDLSRLGAAVGTSPVVHGNVRRCFNGLTIRLSKKVLPKDFK